MAGSDVYQFTYSVNSHVIALHERHHVLEDKLQRVWCDTIKADGQADYQTFGIDDLLPIFQVLGLIEGHPREDWVHESGQYRFECPAPQ